MKFGISTFGKHTIIKLNCKLTKAERAQLADAYIKELSITEIGKGLTRIEGCMNDALYHECFSFDYKMAIQRSKITFAIYKLQEMQASYDDLMAINIAHADDDMGQL